jgi:hypothetical protein
MSKTKSSPQFSVSDAVRVKPGVTDPDFPDIPFGGWAGTIAEIEDDKPRTYLYLIQLNERTLKSIHPIYHKRCERDGLEASQVWMLEEDLEPDIGEPVEIEHPTNILTKPLSMDDQDDRIRAVFGLTSDDPLPAVDDESLLAYYEYLSANLSFPFEAHYSPETGLFSRHTSRVTVMSLGDPDAPWIDDMYGLLCSARLDRRTVDLPVGELEVKEGKPHWQLIADYCYWFWNAR